MQGKPGKTSHKYGQKIAISYVNAPWEKYQRFVHISRRSDRKRSIHKYRCTEEKSDTCVVKNSYTLDYLVVTCGNHYEYKYKILKQHGLAGDVLPDTVFRGISNIIYTCTYVYIYNTRWHGKYHEISTQSSADHASHPTILGKQDKLGEEDDQSTESFYSNWNMILNQDVPMSFSLSSASTTDAVLCWLTNRVIQYDQTAKMGLLISGRHDT